jgi:hypothetical protein
MERTFAGETKVLGENLPQRHFCPSQNPTWPDPSLNPVRRGGKPATNRLSYGAARSTYYLLNRYINKLSSLSYTYKSAKEIIECCRKAISLSFKHKSRNSKYDIQIIDLIFEQLQSNI